MPPQWAVRVKQGHAVRPIQSYVNRIWVYRPLTEGAVGRVAIVGLGVAILAIVFSSDGRASLHHPNDSTGTIPVDDTGAPEALPFDPTFKLRRLVLRNVSNPEWPLVELDPQTKQPVVDPKTGHPKLSDRGVVDERIKKEQRKNAAARTVEESVALAVDLLRFGRPDDAEGALHGQRNGFLPNITLAHIAATQGQWARAYEYLDIANEERPPPSLPGMSAKKLAWQLKVNRGPLLKFVKLRLAEFREEQARKSKLPPEDELPDRIFDVNFVNDAGVYEPGALTASEKAKLPPDALAVVQQLVLWFPNDVRLYWLLAELYSMRGEYAAALDIMNECVSSGRYSNRKVLMQHREAVLKVANVEPPVETPPPPDVPFSMNAVWIYFGAVGAIALFALFRAVTKKRKNSADCGPIG